MIKTLRIVKIFLLLLMLIGCGKAYYFLKDKDGNLIIPKTSYKLYTKLSSCNSIEEPILRFTEIDIKMKVNRMK